MKERRQHIQNIMLAHGLLVMSYESLEDHMHFKDFKKIICIRACILDTIPESASKLVALIVYKSPGVMTPNFTCPNNNHYHQHGIGRQKLREYKGKDFTSISSFIVKNP
jgi:hypothetical protein